MGSWPQGSSGDVRHCASWWTDWPWGSKSHLQQRGPGASGLYQTEHCQHAREGDLFPSAQPCWNTSGILCWGLAVPERRGCAGMSPAQVHRGGEGAAASDIEEADRVGIFQPGAEQVQGILPAWINTWEKETPQIFSAMLSDRARGKRCKLKYSKFHLNIRKKLLTVSVVKHWSWCPRDVVKTSLSSSLQTWLFQFSLTALDCINCLFSSTKMNYLFGEHA